MGKPRAGRNLVAASVTALALAASPGVAGAAPAGTEGARALGVAGVKTKISRQRLVVSAAVTVPARGRILAKVTLNGRVLCRHARRIKHRGTFGVRCSIPRSALEGAKASQAGDGTTGATLGIDFQNIENYSLAWLQSLVPLPPLPPFPPLPS